MEFGYRRGFHRGASVTSYANRDTNAWKRKGLTDEKAREGRVSRDRNDTTERDFENRKKEGEKERERSELQRVNG